MGKLDGDLDVLGVAGLLQVLAANECAGFLTVRQGGQKKVIEFRSSGMRLVSGARRTNPLGEILLRSGRITRPQLEEFLAAQRAGGPPLGEVAARLGLVPRHVVDSALREQVAEEIYDLLTWTGATFEFATSGAAPPPADEGPIASVVLDQNLMSIMLEAARRVDELERIQSVIPDVRLAAVRLELPAQLDDPGLDRAAIEEILPLVDGDRTVGHIIEESLYPRFTVLRTLYGLALRGSLKLLDRGAGDDRPHTVIIRRAPEARDPQTSRPRTIALLSDLPTYRSALALVLRSAGYSVLEGQSAGEDAGRLLTECVHAALVDLTLETEDGMALCRRIRAATDVPFIVLAGNASRQAVSNALDCGARHVLIKPVPQDLLLARVAGLFAPPPEGKGSADPGLGTGDRGLTRTSAPGA